MLRFKIKELMAEKEFQEQRRITIGEISESTGIHRMTLSKILNKHGYSCTTDILDKLCGFFNCKIEDLVEYLPSESKSEIDDTNN